jgi:nucleoside-diphosphate-sugar epimerase
MTARRVLLFGASGFLGRQVADRLAADPGVGEVVRVARDPHAAGWVGHDLVRDDTRTLVDLLRRVRPNAVVNCAGRLAGSTVDLVQANVLVTARLLDAIADAVPRARLVVLGSAAEYGVVPTGRPVGEDDPTNPVGIYGITRLASTQLVRLAAGSGRVDAVALRVFNPIGPGTPAENLIGRAAHELRTAVAEGRDHILLGPLDSHRDLVDVRDVAAAVCAAALADEVKEPVLNVGSGRSVLVRDAVRLLAEVAGFDGQVRESAPAPERSGAVTWIAADIDRIHRVLGWTPQIDLAASIRASWADGE